MKNQFRIATISAFLLCPAMALAQNLSGTLAASDTGSPIPYATVLAIQQGIPPTQRPLVYESRTDATGAFGTTVQPGVYRLCIQGAGFLDPCLWGGARTATVASVSVVKTALLAQRGGRFFLRVHDGLGLLPKAESLPGQAVSVTVTSPSGVKIPLPVAFDDGQLRDYGLLAPLNVPMTVRVTSAHVTLTDVSGAAPNPQGIGFQVTPIPPIPADAVQATFARMFPPPDATIVHVYAVGATAVQ